MSIFIGYSWNTDSGETLQTTQMSSGRSAMKNALQPIVRFKPPRQLSMALDSIRLKGISAAERSAAIARLARLLMEAAGLEIKEIGDDER